MCTGMEAAYTSPVRGSESRPTKWMWATPASPSVSPVGGEWKRRRGSEVEGLREGKGASQDEEETLTSSFHSLPHSTSCAAAPSPPPLPPPHTPAYSSTSFSSTPPNVAVPMAPMSQSSPLTGLTAFISLRRLPAHCTGGEERRGLGWAASLSDHIEQLGRRHQGIGCVTPPLTPPHLILPSTLPHTWMVAGITCFLNLVCSSSRLSSTVRRPSPWEGGGRAVRAAEVNRGVRRPSLWEGGGQDQGRHLRS